MEGTPVADHPSAVPASAAAASDVLAALALVKHGRVYNLDCGPFPGMPIFPGHPPFQVLSYRTPHGIANQGDQHWLGDNEVSFYWQSEMVMGTVHSGTHVDALAHITCGARHEWFGGSCEEEHSGDFGPLRGDATEIPPLIARGVLIDVAGARGVAALAAHESIGAGELGDALARQDVELRRGDVALIRTGYLSGWPDAEFIAAHEQAGIDRDAALWLAEHGAVAVGADTEALEVLPSTVAGNPHPVHIALLNERGIFIIEMVDCEELARDRVYEFCFVCLPLAIRGATGSMVRPVALC
ncbi:MAG: cyclase family protein [Solirubrobacterales bacterium]|nr:cyclase family protein [Solirubrobacterales bacterium]